MAKKVDLTGQTFGRLVVIGESERIKGRRIWKCRCDCGLSIDVRQDSLNSGNTTSCGCFARESSSNNGKKTSVDITNKRFGKVVAIKPTEERSGGHVKWLCKCDCGNTKNISANNLIKGNTSSCGCIASEIAKKTITQTNKTRYHDPEQIKSAHKGLGLVENTSLTLIDQDRKLNKNNTVGIRGVYWNKSLKMWVAQLRFKGERVLDKAFSNKQDAINARKEAEEKYFKPILEKYGKEQKA